MKKRIGLLQKLDCLIRKARAPVYLHRFGPKTYTTRQHLKVWLLKEKFKQSWRDFIDDIVPDYFDNVPDRSTLIKFVKRLPFWLKNRLIAESAGADPVE